METIIGDARFFNFIETDYDGGKVDPSLMRKLFTTEVDGFVTKGVFSQEEVSQILEATKQISADDKLYTSNGEVFPMPFATIRNTGFDLDRYKAKLEALDIPLFSLLKDRLAEFFNAVGGDFDVKVPDIIIEGKEGSAAFGNFRFFLPELGGLFVHCGNLFQEDSPVYYQVVEDMDKKRQLSFFVALQYPESGGELTIYNMLWPEVNAKDDFENNEYVLDCNGNRLYLDKTEQFLVRPRPGDLLVFRGGPIWHRVEPILGDRPRITFGGFMNYSEDGDKFFYWS